MSKPQTWRVETPDYTIKLDRSYEPRDGEMYADAVSITLAGAFLTRDAVANLAADLERLLRATRADR